MTALTPEEMVMRTDPSVVALLVLRGDSTVSYRIRGGASHKEFAEALCVIAADLSASIDGFGDVQNGWEIG